MASLSSRSSLVVSESFLVNYRLMKGQCLEGGHQLEHLDFGDPAAAQVDWQEVGSLQVEEQEVGSLDALTDCQKTRCPGLACQQIL